MKIAIRHDAKLFNKAFVFIVLYFCSLTKITHLYNITKKKNVDKKQQDKAIQINKLNQIQNFLVDNYHTNLVVMTQLLLSG